MKENAFCSSVMYNRDVASAELANHSTYGPCVASSRTDRSWAISIGCSANLQGGTLTARTGKRINSGSGGLITSLMGSVSGSGLYEWRGSVLSKDINGHSDFTPFEFVTIRDEKIATQNAAQKRCELTL